MVLPPILDIFVVWHPNAELGPTLFRWLSDHFHSATFSGLAGGAVEVYGRSSGWSHVGSSPRPLGIESPVAGDLPAAQFNAIVPLLDINMARAVRDEDSWADYMRDIGRLRKVKGIGVFPLSVPGSDLRGSLLEKIMGEIQQLPTEAIGDPARLARELSQAIVQRIESEVDVRRQRVRVFVSHTKHDSLEEADQEGPLLFDAVRDVLNRTRLGHFFDAQDLQTGSEWERELEDNAASCALLMVRTDKYAGRDWTQKEVLIAKLHDVPIVGMYALSSGEERGSFLMDHVPSVSCQVAKPHSDIEMALNRLVDEALKRTIWLKQSVYLREEGFDWTPVHAPEPVTLTSWLKKRKREGYNKNHVWIIHPDPPLGPKELDIVMELCELAGFGQDVEVLTPHTFSARGGRLLR
ncbi:MAG: hypothetical protein JWO93_334 [Micrococcaceae bacterium]|nr:hypothetical protein [Micrococcaceae bacterium]